MLGTWHWRHRSRTSWPISETLGQRASSPTASTVAPETERWRSSRWGSEISRLGVASRPAIRGAMEWEMERLGFCERDWGRTWRWEDLPLLVSSNLWSRSWKAAMAAEGESRVPINKGKRLYAGKFFFFWSAVNNKWTNWRNSTLHSGSKPEDPVWPPKSRLNGFKNKKKKSPSPAHQPPEYLTTRESVSPASLQHI